MPPLSLHYTHVKVASHDYIKEKQETVAQTREFVDINGLHIKCMKL